MSAVADIASPAPASLRRARQHGRPPAGAPPLPVMDPWLQSQSLNSVRHAAALRPFRAGEFGTSPAAPSPGHLAAANELIVRLRAELLRLNRPLREATDAARRNASPAALGRVLALKESADSVVRGIERVWDHYWVIFGQRTQLPYADWLVSCDRIGLDCYQAAFRGVGAHKTVPAPGPFAYMRTGFSPATFRRGLPLMRLGRNANPFPLVELPYHRLVNPWTLGAVLHEISHNLHSDLGLDRRIPAEITRRLSAERMPASVVRTWSQWNRESFADLSGLLLGGPAIVASLMDVVGRSRPATYAFVPGAPHPTPYLRAQLSIELLRRMGFGEQARRFERAWSALYPRALATRYLPQAMLATARRAIPVVVDAICFTAYAELGDRSLARSYRFEVKDQLMIEDAGRRLAAGTDPGIVPARFLIGAARVALDRRLARPGAIAENFYRELSRR
jgi:hypothetical protein